MTGCTVKAQALVDQMGAAFNNAQALSEGWGVFQFDGSYQLQRHDEAEIFKSDDAAWRFVVKQACTFDSVYHRAALLWLARNAPTEFELIMENDGVSTVGADRDEMFVAVRNRLRRAKKEDA